MLRLCPYKAGVGGSSPSTPTTKPLVVNGGFWLSREQPTTCHRPQRSVANALLVVTPP